MGIGNSLLQDDGVGVHVVDALRTDFRGDWLRLGLEPRIIDAGTVGLALLPTLEDADAVIVIDAAEIGLAPGALRVFRDGDIDRLLSGKRRTVHEVALADLFAAAALRGRSPARRALIAIQPGSTDWGVYPTPAVAATIPLACGAVWDLLKRWQAPGRGASCLDGQTTGMAWSVLAEIGRLLEALAARGEAGAIDLRSLPLTDADRAQLESLLGRGEVRAELDLAGRSEVWETAYPGAWWVRHLGAAGRVAAETIAICLAPDILAAHPADVQAGARRLRCDLEQHAPAAAPTAAQTLATPENPHG